MDGKLKILIDKSELTHSEFGEKIRTPLRTLERWLATGNIPDNISLLIDVLLNVEEARKAVGINFRRKKHKPRGKPFKKGNPYRFGAGE
jgi:hypothetical protein